MIIDKGLYIFEDFDLTVFTLDPIFENTQLCLSIYNDIIYNIERFNYDAKSLLLHHLLTQTFKYFTQLDKLYTNKVLLVQPSFAEHAQNIFKTTDDKFKQKLIKFILTNFKKISKQAPFPIFVQNYNTDLTNEDAGELIELLNKISREVSIHLLKSPNLNKLKQFTSEKGLKQLTGYFSSENMKSVYLKQ